MNHVKRPHETDQSTAKKALQATLKRGFKPMQQWRTIVRRSAAMENSDAAVSRMKVQGVLHLRRTVSLAQVSP